MDESETVFFLPEGGNLRRVLDFALATVGLVAASPLLVLAAMAIYLNDRRNPIFSQERLGKNEKVFTLYKLRTMHPKTPTVATHNLTEAALTPIGSLLRKTKLDELPQLVNVIRGDMSLVGPRPGLPGHHRLTEARRNEGVFEILPGITGLAQLQGVDMSQPEKLASTDREYIEERTLLGDLRLLVQTAVGTGNGDAIGEA